MPNDADKRLDEAADWFEREADGTIDRAAFDQWMRDPRNIEAWLDICDDDASLEPLRAARAVLKDLDTQNVFVTPANDDQSTQPAGPGPVDASPAASDAPHRRQMLYWLTGVAGVSAVGLSAYVANAKESAQTKVGEQRIVNLPDGAILDMNTDTKALWRINGSTRDIWLEKGEIALTARDASSPFILMDGSKSVLAFTNGELNVRRRGQVLAVTVVAGAALMQKSLAGGPVVHAGMTVSATGNRAQIVAGTPSDVAKTVLWRQRQLSFDGETLAEAVSEFNRYLPHKIVVADPTLNGLHLLATGNWKIDAPEDFLNMLSTSMGVAVTREDDGGYLLQKSTGRSGV